MNIGDIVEYTVELQRGVWAVYGWRKTAHGRVGSKMSEHLHKWEAEYEMKKLNKQLNQ